MAWQAIQIEFNDVSLSGHVRGNTFSAPFFLGLEAGDSFKAGGTKYKVEAVTDVSGRGETLFITAKEVKNDKPKSRRVPSSSGGSGVDSTSDDGQLGSDRDEL